jgi:hypothetical protein
MSSRILDLSGAVYFNPDISAIVLSGEGRRCASFDLIRVS